MSLVLGVALGIGVGVISGLEPAVVIGVSASMAMGCVFVMSFAILHGVSAVRALVFAMFVSACMPLGFGVGVGIGIMIAIVFGLEDPDELREKTRYFVTHFAEFVQEVVVFSIDILKLR